MIFHRSTMALGRTKNRTLVSSSNAGLILKSFLNQNPAFLINCCVVKVVQGSKRTQADSRLVNPSQAWGFYSDHLSEEHALYPILVTHADFYKAVRNVGNHHEGLEWDPVENMVILRESPTEAPVKAHLHDFQRWYRHLSRHHRAIPAIGLVSFSEDSSAS